MPGELTVGLLQLNSGEDVQKNIEQTCALIRQAAAGGAEFILTPEMTSILEIRSGRLFDKTCDEEVDPALAAFRSLARELDVWLLIGSLAVRLAENSMTNRSYLIDPGGRLVARYDKMHMFDVELGKGQTYRESKNFSAGKHLVVAETPWGLLGLSICYDIRFPYLYRRLARMGAKMLAVPSAFTKTTGRAHWHVLLRARAIETGCFLLAPAQCGRHSGGRQTFGHSLVVNPWGEIIKEAGEEVGVMLAKLDLNEVDKARRKIPSLKHTVPISEI
ncbi:MAG: carbon-nitrogen hydrolase family protein [Sphingomonadales bacterium]